MQRYFFHIIDDDGEILDGEGMMFANDQAARREGERSARDVLGSDIRWGNPIGTRRIQVVNSKGALIATFGLSEVLALSAALSRTKSPRDLSTAVEAIVPRDRNTHDGPQVSGESNQQFLAVASVRF